MVKVKELDATAGENEGLFSRMFGNVKAKARKFVVQYDKLSVTSTEWLMSLKKPDALLKDIAFWMDYMKRTEYMHQLDVYILRFTELNKINENYPRLGKSRANQ